MKRVLLIIAVMMTASLAYSQKSTDNMNMDFDVSAYENIRIHNYNGNVTVNAKPGKTLSLKVKRTLTSGSGSELAKAKEEVYLDTTVIDGEFIVFMVAPQKFFKVDDEGNSYYNGPSWNNWSKGNIKEYGVEYEFEIEATIPPEKNLYAATHRKDVDVIGIQGKTTVKTHHGSVKAKTGAEEVIAKSHHGDVTVEHTGNNVTSGVYKTHHGDIRTTFPSLNAVASMDSHHGDFYIDYDYEFVAQKVSIIEDGRKTKYKYGGETNIKVGNGNGKLTYRTHHGDTYITKN
ncbi:DUF4097 family beta strand repeat-containing protein [Portibacter marinus]|uniref:hypothetical protein n=1 Tax=Portibacter marinus TaxID=2898660 RepID=UPI001F45E2CF|nr:hypothetical protein [Portibacter marinus]